jgi:hypothetical protein
MMSTKKSRRLNSPFTNDAPTTLPKWYLSARQNELEEPFILPKYQATALPPRTKLTNVTQKLTEFAKEEESPKELNTYQH